MKELRDYQKKAIKAVEMELYGGSKAQLLVMSMGLGKTFTAVKIDEQLQSKKTFWVTDDERLLEQSAMAFINDKFDKPFADRVNKEGFINFYRNGGVCSETGYKMSIIKADLFDTSGDIVFCSAQTLWRRLDKLDPNLCDIMFIDEAHCFGAKTLYQGINHFTPRLKLGLTGSPYRTDGVLLGDIFDTIAFEYGMRDGIKDGWLCELDAVRIKTNVSLDKVHTSAGDFNKEELSNEINTLARNNLIAQSYLQYAKGRQAIGFGVDINHCMCLTEAFQQHGINAVAISSDEERTGDKNVKIKAYRNGEIDVLFNVNLLSKGFDHPDTGCAITAAPTKSLVRYLQGPAGRINRLKSPDYVAKFGQNAILLDITDNSTRHNIINAWGLDKGLPPEDRVFITSEKRAKLLLDREKRAAAKLNHTQEKDERVSLLQLPKVKISKSLRMSESATEAQLAVISRWGYDIANTHYSKEMVSEIFGKQSASLKTVEFLKYKGYSCEGFVSVAEAMAASEEIKKRESLK
jgi:superfamily II DNA or RNA helicase